MKIDQALYALLTGAAGVSAYVSTRVYPGFVPEAQTAAMLKSPTALSCISYDLVSSGDEMTHSGGTGLFTSELQITAMDPDYATVRGMVNAIRAALQSSAAVWGTLPVYRTETAAAVPIEYRDDIGLHMGTVSVTVLHAKET